MITAVNGDIQYIELNERITVRVSMDRLEVNHANGHKYVMRLDGIQTHNNQFMWKCGKLTLVFYHNTYTLRIDLDAKNPKQSTIYKESCLHPGWDTCKS